MPWCPQCKYEYKAGIKVCADCGCELVDELPKESENAEMEFDPQAAMQFYESYIDDDASDQNMEVESRPIRKKAYVDSAQRAAEYKAGAGTLLLVGIVGAVLLVLADLGIIHFYMSPGGKYLINIVMGGMFLLFIILGFASIKSYKKLAVKATEEKEIREKMIEWSKDNLTKEFLTKGEDTSADEEILYFGRYQTIYNMIKENFPETDDGFAEQMAEKIYSDIFE